MAKQEDGTIRVVLLRDYWPEEDRRLVEGTEIMVSSDEAFDMIERGVAKRVKAGA